MSALVNPEAYDKLLAALQKLGQRAVEFVLHLEAFAMLFPKKWQWRRTEADMRLRSRLFPKRDRRVIGRYIRRGQVK